MVTANMTYAGKYSFKGIGYRGVTMPNDSTTPLVAEDAGKTVAWGTDGLKVAAADAEVLGVFFDMDTAGAITMQDVGYAYVSIADSSTVAVGDYVVADGNGGVQLKTGETTGATVAHSAKVAYIVDSTTVVIKL